MIDSVIFDMDGLLIDSEPFWREAERKVFAGVGIQMTDAMCESAMGLRISEVIEHWHRLYPWETPGFDAIEKDILNLVGRLIGERGALMDGVSEILLFFKERSVPMAVASASPMALIDLFLERFQLRSHFRVVHSAEYEPYGKPHPAVFLSTAQKMNVHPTRVLVFEDSFNGLIAAKAARMKAVAVPAPEHRHQSRWVIADRVLERLTDWNEKLWTEFRR